MIGFFLSENVNIQKTIILKGYIINNTNDNNLHFTL